MKNADIIDILLVEDNPRDIELMARVFKKRNIANPMHISEDGADALDFIFGRGAYAGRNALVRPKVIFLDLKLPKVSGLDILRTIKSDEQTRSIPVVVVTSSREDPDVTEAYALGANSYVVKPVDFESFVEAISNLGLYWIVVNQPPY
jgi:two-component system response regulator